MNLDSHLDIYKEFLFSEKNLSQNTINNYIVDLKQFLLFFINHKSINENIKKYISSLRKKNISKPPTNTLRLVKSIKTCVARFTATAGTRISQNF